jgi:hypothetical protein
MSRLRWIPESTMIHVIRADERHFTDFDWLKTYWLFV